jgi:hypothetical protein
MKGRVIKMRQEIREFAEEMERIMLKHDHRKGDTWKSSNMGDFLIDKFHEEFKESVEIGADPSEFVDVANIAMMLWWRKTHGVYNPARFVDDDSNEKD